MNKFLKISIINFLVVITLLLQVLPATAVSFLKGDTVSLEKDHDCISLLKIKGKDMLKGVTYVVYKNSQTGEKQPAFCVEPEKEGIGTGAGDSYDVTLDFLNDERLWRILYKGFMGSTYKDWNLECEDDLYYATKTAVHSLVQKISPIDKYEEPTRVGYGENISFEDVLRRGRKVLKVSQELYEYGINGTDYYQKPQIKITEKQEEIKTINGKEFLIKSFESTANRKIDSFDVEIKSFPEGSFVLDKNYNPKNRITENSFKIVIPTEKITDNIDGKINIKNIKIKTYPVFYANAKNENNQDYITYFSNYEEVETSTKTNVDGYKSKIIINKIDENTKEVIQGVKFKLLNDKKQELGTYETNKNGQIIIEKLKNSTYYLKEEAKDGYYENKDDIRIDVKWNETKEIIVENKKVEIEVNIKKEGPKEAKKNEIIEYTFSDIENKSNIALDELIWTEYVPEETKINKLYTGTWNDNIKYSIWYKTNKNDYIKLKDNLSTQENNEINFGEVKIDEDEFITEYQLKFENVKVGFKEEEKPKLLCKVFDNVENGYIIENKTDVVGKYRKQIDTKKSNWKTIIYTPEEPQKVLPRTGK